MMLPGLREAPRAINKKHRAEPDLGARDWRFEDEEEVELHGDDFARLSLDDEL